MKKQQQQTKTTFYQYWKWHFQKFWQEHFKLGDGANTAKNLKLFSYALIIGLIVMLLILLIVGINPFAAFGDGFQMLGEYKTSQDRFMCKIAIFGLAGIAVGIGFKTGLFNIGVSGQMTLGGLLAGTMALYAQDHIAFGWGQLIVLILSVLGGALLAALAGILKAYFKISEVVSTILLNWIMFFILQACIRNFFSDFSNSTKLGTIDFGDNYLFTYDSPFGKMGGWIALSILGLAIIGIYILIYKTTFGHKMIIVGKNQDAALAAGINVRWVTIASMAISGAIAGLLGIVVYFIQDKNFQVALTDVIPQYGFDGIAIAILAFSNPLATLPVAVIFGLIQAIIDNTTLIDATFGPLVTGILILTAAINQVFLKINWQRWWYKLFYSKTKQESLMKRQQERQKLAQNYYEKYNSCWYQKRQQLLDLKQNRSWKLCFSKQKSLAKSEILSRFKLNINSLIEQHEADLKMLKTKNQNQQEVKRGIN